MSRWKPFASFRTLIVVAAVALISIGMMPIQAQGSGWNLVQMFPGTTCMSYRDGGTPNPTAWLLLDITGTWTHPIRFGLRQAPRGATVGRTTFDNGNPVPYHPIQPGNDLAGANGRVEVTVHQGSTPTRTFHATLWANDGVTEQTLPVTIVVQQAKCSGY